MDEKSFFGLFKNLRQVMRCPSCGSVYEMSDTQFVGGQDGYFLLSLNCTKCSLPVWVNVFAGNSNRDNLPANDLTINDLHLKSLEPISLDEVIKFSTYIRSFKKDFSKIFKPYK